MLTSPECKSILKKSHSFLGNVWGRGLNPHLDPKIKGNKYLYPAPFLVYTPTSSATIVIPRNIPIE